MTEADRAAGGMRTPDLSSDAAEFAYAESRDLDYRRQLGQFFTPFPVARFMAQWLADLPSASPEILDPCAGLGVFERALCEVDPRLARNARFALWEKDRRLARQLEEICVRLGIEHAIACRDFLHGHAWTRSYDAIIANPPYYKHHFVDDKQAIRDELSCRVGHAFSVQTNVYCWFLIKALTLLRTGGRLAFIVPTEFLSANYGVPVKQFLRDSGYLRHIISVHYKSRAFDDALTTACVLLAEKKAEPAARIRFYLVDTPERLGDLAAFINGQPFSEYRSCELDAERKWRSYFPGSVSLPQGVKLVRFDTYGRFSRGIATGANRFFAIPSSMAAGLELPHECLVPCVSKARHAPHKVFTQRDFEALKHSDKPVLLFDGEAAGGGAVAAYIRTGRRAGYHERYLTRSRDPWYALEKRRPGRIWAAVFGRSGIRFVWNESNCLSLTCFHVFTPSESGGQYLPFLFLYLNSSTGRRLLELEKREYGDGLEKYEPNDINRAPAPDFTALAEVRKRRLAALQAAFIAEDRGSDGEKAILDEADAIFAQLTRRA